MTPQEQIRQEGGMLRVFERKLDKCNHLMELMRTCLGLCTLILQIIILLKLFNVIWWKIIKTKNPLLKGKTASLREKGQIKKHPRSQVHMGLLQNGRWTTSSNDVHSKHNRSREPKAEGFKNILLRVWIEVQKRRIRYSSQK